MSSLQAPPIGVVAIAVLVFVVVVEKVGQVRGARVGIEPPADDGGEGRRVQAELQKREGPVLPIELARVLEDHAVARSQKDGLGRQSRADAHPARAAAPIADRPAAARRRELLVVEQEGTFLRQLPVTIHGLRAPIWRR
jgi:hypothetical protein